MIMFPTFLFVLILPFYIELLLRKVFFFFLLSSYLTQVISFTLTALTLNLPIFLSNFKLISSKISFLRIRLLQLLRHFYLDALQDLNSPCQSWSQQLLPKSLNHNTFPICLISISTKLLQIVQSQHQPLPLPHSTLNLIIKFYQSTF